LKISGAKNSGLFSEKAIEKIFDYTGGVPRNINILCDASLVYGYADQLPMIDESLVGNVIEDKKEMGLGNVLSSPEPPPVVAEGGEGYGELMSRLENLEQQVHRIATAVEWQARKLETQEDQYKDVLVNRLESMLRAERQRSDRLLAQCNILKDRLQPGSVRKVAEKAKKPPEPKAGKTNGYAGTDKAQNGKGNGKPNVLQRWFGK
jgi:general secretion pathway protein A